MLNDLNGTLPMPLARWLPWRLRAHRHRPGRRPCRALSGRRSGRPKRTGRSAARTMVWSTTSTNILPIETDVDARWLVVFSANYLGVSVVGLVSGQARWPGGFGTHASSLRPNQLRLRQPHRLHHRPPRPRPRHYHRRHRQRRGALLIAGSSPPLASIQLSTTTIVPTVRGATATPSIQAGRVGSGSPEA